MALELDVVVGELAELDVVDADLLVLGRDAQAQARDQVHEEQDDAGQHERVREAGDRVGDLERELDVVVVDPAAGDDAEPIEVRYVVTVKNALVHRSYVDRGWGYERGEKTGEQVADDTANTVDSEDIESVIGAHDELELGGNVAADSTDNAENDSSPGRDVTGGRGDGN